MRLLSKGPLNLISCFLGGGTKDCSEKELEENLDALVPSSLDAGHWFGHEGTRVCTDLSHCMMIVLALQFTSVQVALLCHKACWTVFFTPFWPFHLFWIKELFKDITGGTDFSRYDYDLVLYITQFKDKRRWGCWREITWLIGLCYLPQNAEWNWDAIFPKLNSQKAAAGLALVGQHCAQLTLKIWMLLKCWAASVRLNTVMGSYELIISKYYHLMLKLQLLASLWGTSLW